MEADDTKAGKVKKIIDGMPKNDINNGRRACDKLSEDAIPQGLIDLAGEPSNVVNSLIFHPLSLAPVVAIPYRPFTSDQTPTAAPAVIYHTVSANMAPNNRGIAVLIVPEHILAKGVFKQTQSPLFGLSMDAFRLIMRELESRDFDVIDRVMFALTCKSAARILQVAKARLPNPITDRNNVDSSKRARLNFMLRMGPYFDDLSATRDAILPRRELDVKLPMGEIVIVANGWAFCVSCLKYRRTTIFMKQVESRNYPKTIRWTRCLPGITSTSAPDVTLSTEVCTELNNQANYSGWNKIDVDKKKMPLYKAVRRLPKSNGGSASSSPAKKGKGKAKAADPIQNNNTIPQPRAGAIDWSLTHVPSQNTNPKITYASMPATLATAPVVPASPAFIGPRVKTSAPKTSAIAQEIADAKAKEVEEVAKEKKRLAEEAERFKYVTGTEDCTYLPVDASGTMRLTEVGICDAHVIDALKLFGI